MKTKRIIMIGTVAFAITISGGIWGKEANADNSTLLLGPSESIRAKEAVLPVQPAQAAESNEFLQLLGVSTDEEVHDALYNGQSLADLATRHNKAIQPLIDLQIGELTKQLDQRLSDGCLSQSNYQAQKLEIPDIIKRSILG